MLKIIIKDLKIISDKLILFVIGYSIVTILFSVMDKSLIVGSMALLVFFPISLLLTTIFLLMYYDDKNKFSELFYSLPNSKIDILYSKYILTFATLILGLLASYLIFGILNFLESYELINLENSFSLQRGLEFNYFEFLQLFSLPIFIFPIYLKTRRAIVSVVVGIIVLILFGWGMFYLIYLSQGLILDQMIDAKNIEFVLVYYIDIVSTVVILVSSFISAKVSKYLTFHT